MADQEEILRRVEIATSRFFLLDESKRTSHKDKNGDDGFDPLVCVVPLGSDNSHNYDIGKPAICVTRTRCLRYEKGELGNNLTVTKRLIRKATFDEMKDAVRKAGSEGMDRLESIIRKDK